MGCDIIRQDNGAIIISPFTKIAELDPQLLREVVGHSLDQLVTEQEAAIFRCVIRKMLFIGRNSAPFMLMDASMAASKIINLK